MSHDVACLISFPVGEQLAHSERIDFAICGSGEGMCDEDRFHMRISQSHFFVIVCAVHTSQASTCGYLCSVQVYICIPMSIIPSCTHARNNMTIFTTHISRDKEGTRRRGACMLDNNAPFFDPVVI
jgi:hypothetical protein